MDDSCLQSAQNPRIKQAVKLRSKRARDQSQLFLIEGYRELLVAAKRGVSIDTLFFSPTHFLGSGEKELIETIRKAGATIYEVSPPLFDKLSYRDRGDGLLAIAHQTHNTLKELKEQLATSSPPFIVIAEAIEKPGNLGSILRSADAAGVNALILCDPCTDPHNPNVVRASVGTLFTVPIIEMSSQEALAVLSEHGLKLIAATPQASATFTETDLTGPIAIAVGTEQLGLSPLWLNSATDHVKIPMHGHCDSLNVAAATTLLLYEVVRQRHTPLNT